VDEERFLAYSHRNENDPVELECAVSYDVGLDIDQRNGWVEPDDVPSKRAVALEESKKQAAIGLAELLRFCFEKKGCTRRGMRRAQVRFFSVAHGLAIPMYARWEKRNGKRRPMEGTRLNAREIASLIRVKPADLRREYNGFRRRWPFTVHVRPSKHALRRPAR